MLLNPNQMPFDDDLFEKNQQGELTIKPGSLGQSLIEGGGG